MPGLPILAHVRRRLSPPTPLMAKADPTHLRVMTYNTHHGADRAGVGNIEAIALTIEECRPDVVALQEVDRRWGERSGRLDQPAWYAERLGMQVDYAATIREPSDAGSPAEYGLATLSVLPMSGRQYHRYLGSAGAHDEPRGFLTVFVTAEKGKRRQPRTVRIINTHLAVRNRGLREQEMTQLMSYTDSDRDLPTVLAGDLNARLWARALREVRQSYRNAWDVGRGSPSTVWGRRIDYLWMSSHFRPVQTVVIRSWASDHFALVSDLAWN
jgi:endonuclease/exonuclease/phosphatase family metal-dependent hydrolase